MGNKFSGWKRVIWSVVASGPWLEATKMKKVMVDTSEDRLASPMSRVSVMASSILDEESSRGLLPYVSVRQGCSGTSQRNQRWLRQQPPNVGEAKQIRVCKRT